MLFHITHTHTPATCPYHDPEDMKATFGQIIANLEATGVKAHGMYVDPPAHTIYMIVEADRAEQIEELLSPAFGIGHAETRVVSDALGVLERRSEA